MLLGKYIYIHVAPSLFCRAYLLYYGTDAESTPTVLPMGNYDVSFINEVKLYIYDQIGDYYIYTRNVTVSTRVL